MRIQYLADTAITVVAVLLCMQTTSAFVHPQSRITFNTPTILHAPTERSHYHHQQRIMHSTTKLYGFFDRKNNIQGGTEGQIMDYTTMEPKVYSQRWIQLGYLSALALLSDWICFSVAAAPETFEATWGHSAASLIDIFLFTNVASCFLVTDIVAKFGLQTAIQGAGILMALGCWFRSGLAFLLPAAQAIGWDASNLIVADNTAGLVPYPLVVIGTLLVGAAQPFFQCTPPLLSAQWFASDERATSTAVALNFNQIGIAIAFLVGGTMATSQTGLEQYFGLISLISTVVVVGSLLQFENLPPTPPSSSELEKFIHGEKEPPFLDSVKTFFNTPGFTRPLAAFICSISITNIVGAFIDDVMKRGGIVEQFTVNLAGAGFEFAILIGGIIIGGYVDRTKKYKSVTLGCIALTAAFLVPLGLTDHAIGQEPVLLILALLGLGVVAGPVQPINAELAVDVTYPGDETAVESVQQIGGNLMSALLVPLAEIAAEKDYQLIPNSPELASDIRGDVVLMTAIALATFIFFSSFDAPLKRSMADSHDHGAAVSVPMNGEVQLNGVPLALDAMQETEGSFVEQ